MVCDKCKAVRVDFQVSCGTDLQETVEGLSFSRRVSFTVSHVLREKNSVMV